MAGPVYLFDQSTTHRIRESVRKTENQIEDVPDLAQHMLQDAHVVRLRLITPLEYGRQGIGLLLAIDNYPPKTSRFDWEILSNLEIPVWLGLCSQTRIDSGVEITAVLTEHGYVAVTGGLMAYVPGGSATELTVVPYGVYKISSGVTLDSNEDLNTVLDLDSAGALKLRGNTSADSDMFQNWAGLEIFEYDYAFLGRTHNTYPAWTKLIPSKTKKPTVQATVRLFPCTTDLPAWVAYKTDPQDDIPQEVLDALEWKSEKHPNPGELWGPVFQDAYLHRSATILELYWWEWLIEGISEQQKVTLTNAPASQSWHYVLDGVQSAGIVSTAPASVVQTALEGMSNVGAGNVTVAGDPGGPYTISFVNDRALQAISQGQLVAATGSAVAGHVQTLIDGRDELKRQFISPNGWWGSWGWSGWGWTGQYPYHHWHYNGVSSSYYGAWGYGWWNGRWGGKPPSAVDKEFTGDAPTPPEGTITRYCIYGYIVWEHGWNVISVDQLNQLAFIGPDKEIKFNRTLVVVNGSIEDCPTYVGGSV